MREFFPLFPLAVAVLFAPVVLAAGKAMPAEAKAMVVKAPEYLKSVGSEKAFAEFDAKEGPWRDRDPTVTVADANGMARANGANPGLVGKDVFDLKDPDGKAFPRETLAIKDTGEVTVRWMNPVSHAIEPKTFSIVRVGDHTVGVGAYAK